MAVTNAALSVQIEGIGEKLDDFIDVQRASNDVQRVSNDACQAQLRELQTEQARQGERLSHLRNIFGGIQLMFGALLAWVGLK